MSTTRARPEHAERKLRKLADYISVWSAANGKRHTRVWWVGVCVSYQRGFFFLIVKTITNNIQAYSLRSWRRSFTEESPCTLALTRSVSHLTTVSLVLFRTRCLSHHLKEQVSVAVTVESCIQQVALVAIPNKIFRDCLQSPRVHATKLLHYRPSADHTGP
jgi:hypothetical protein